MHMHWATFRSMPWSKTDIGRRCAQLGKRRIAVGPGRCALLASISGRVTFHHFSVEASTSERSYNRFNVAKQQEDSLKASKRVHDHPSKERERARRLKHLERAKRWEPAHNASQASGEWPEEFFEEKWSHAHGRLSDWNPSSVADSNPKRPQKSVGSHKDQRSRDNLEAGSRDKSLRSVVETPDPQPDEDVENQGGGSPWRFFATCHPGLEEVVAHELRGPQIRALKVTPGRSGVTFWGESLETGFRACLWLRAAVRVLVLLAEGPLDTRTPSGNSIYQWTREAVDWADLIGAGQCFSVDVRLRDCTGIPSSQLVATRIKDGICDAVRDQRGEKLWPPDRDRGADVPLFAAFWRDQGSLYRELSGGSLHRRSHATAIHRASLNEAAAAGVLYLAGWPRPDAVLADPMCGSGTFLVEAALMALNRAPGMVRQDWPFLSWPDFDPLAWRRCQEEAKEVEASAPKVNARCFLGNEIHSGALSLARTNAHAAGVADLIDFSEGNCRHWKPANKPDLVVTNPPWGQRIAGRQRDPSLRWSPSTDGKTDAGPEFGTNDELTDAWADLQHFLKSQCPSAEAFLLSGNRSATAALRMKASAKYPLGIGGIDCRLLKYFVLPPKTAHF